jgi:hypothetical protein
MYPKNFFFAVTRDGVEGRRSMLLEGGHRRRRSSTVTSKDQRRQSLIVAEKEKEAVAEEEMSEDEEDEAVDTEMSELTGAMSALQFVPMSVRFGRGGGKAGFSRR